MKTDSMNKSGYTRDNGGSKMKSNLIIACGLLMIILTGTAFAEEAGCFQHTDNWIIRVYSEGTASPYSFTVAVVDPATGLLVPHSSIKAFSGATSPCLNADSNVTNLCVIESGAQSPDLSLGCDSAAGTVYIVHDNAGQLAISTIPEIVKYVASHAVLQVTPAALDFNKVMLTPMTMQVTVTNKGTANLHISSVTLPSAPYSKQLDTCTGATIAPATGTCSIAIKFAPTGAGLYTGSFSINSDGGPATVQLTGEKLAYGQLQYQF